MSDTLVYTNINSYTLLSDPNTFYWSNTKNMGSITSINDPSIGLLVILSVFQYQTPYINPMYSEAANKASQAAFIQSGAQTAQDKISQIGIDFAHSMGVNDMEMGIFVGTVKTVKNRQMEINGPKLYSIKTHLTGTQNSTNIGFKYEW